MFRNIYIFDPPGDRVELDVFYFEMHVMSAFLNSGPSLRRHWSFRAFEVPEEADGFNVARYRMTEMWYGSREEWEEQRRYSMGFSGAGDWPKPEPGDPEGGPRAGIATSPAPTRVFMDTRPRLREKPYLRWMIVMRYPEEVPVEQGDDWYLNTHGPELAKLPGLLRFVTYDAFPGPQPMSRWTKRPWVRLSELWFENYSAWRAAILESPPDLTPPPWGGEFPFVEMVSTFVPHLPDVDVLHPPLRPPTTGAPKLE
jgi:hypothetical protein